jgi:hypothetical protein
MPRPRASDRHPDLFAPEGPQPPMAAAERAELLALVGALLAEAIAAAVAEVDDEDRA